METEKGRGINNYVKIKNIFGNELNFENLRSFIVPVFKQNLQTKKLESLIGSAFLITSDIGLIISAKHVFNVAIDEKNNNLQKFGLIIIQIKNNNWHWRPILKIGFSENTDLGIGLCSDMIHKQSKEYFQNDIPILAASPPEIGEQVFTLSYPSAEVKQVEETTHIGLPLEPYVGVIKKHHSLQTKDEYVKKMISLPCYETTIQLHSGASGGPVFDSIGRIIGINHRGLSYEDGKEPLSWLLRIQDLFNLKWSEEIPTIQDLIIQKKVIIG